MQKKQRKIEKCLKHKEYIKVAFIFSNPSIWKLDILFGLMQKSRRFKPYIILCPTTNYEDNDSLMLLAERYLKRKGYYYFKAYNTETRNWNELIKDLKPDLIFYYDPWDKNGKNYSINKFRNSLTCYVPYGIMSSNIQENQYNRSFHNYLWRAFYETDVHMKMAEKYAFNKGQNVVVTGYPIFDEFILREKDGYPDVWKIKNRQIKRIIWAPHWSIDQYNKDISYSCFLEFSYYMFDLLKKYNKYIQIAFKPHPKLKTKLYSHPEWGRNKTDVYYESWKEIENGQLVEDEYIDLFLSSDAIILDSISFMTEYLYVKKPILFTVRDEGVKTKFNEYGMMVYDLLYKGYSKDDLEVFLKNVMNNIDPDLLKRTYFFNKYFKQTDGKYASKNILNHLLEKLS